MVSVVDPIEILQVMPRSTNDRLTSAPRCHRGIGITGMVLGLSGASGQLYHSVS